jgi:hypothetical protein
VVPDALIFAMTTGGPKEEFDALLQNATPMQLNSFGSKGRVVLLAVLIARNDGHLLCVQVRLV